MASIVRKILAKSIADSLVQKGSRLAHLYGFPKTHKEKLAIRPILSATGTYNYKLAKWLDERLKPLSTIEHTIGDIFSFVDDLQEMEISDHDIFLHCLPTYLWTRLVRKAFQDDWFNRVQP